jgi:hypothetical protein
MEAGESTRLWPGRAGRETDEALPVEGYRPGEIGDMIPMANQFPRHYCAFHRN